MALKVYKWLMLMAGVMLVVLGLTGAQAASSKHIPDPVIVGFTSGIGLIIFVGQWKKNFLA